MRNAIGIKASDRYAVIAQDAAQLGASMVGQRERFEAFYHAHADHFGGEVGIMARLGNIAVAMSSRPWHRRIWDACETHGYYDVCDAIVDALYAEPFAFPDQLLTLALARWSGRA